MSESRPEKGISTSPHNPSQTRRGSTDTSIWERQRIATGISLSSKLPAPCKYCGLYVFVSSPVKVLQFTFQWIPTCAAKARENASLMCVMITIFASEAATTNNTSVVGQDPRSNYLRETTADYPGDDYVCSGSLPALWKCVMLPIKLYSKETTHNMDNAKTNAKSTNKTNQCT
ncbi:hypothetical protein FKM82_011350 [Ascaphus truei]